MAHKVEVRLTVKPTIQHPYERDFIGSGSTFRVATMRAAEKLANSLGLYKSTSAPVTLELKRIY